MNITEPGAFRNLGPDPQRPGFWQVEVLTGSGEWFHFQGIWCRNDEDARERAAGLARQYINFIPEPKEVRERKHAEFMADIAMWGCE